MLNNTVPVAPKELSVVSSPVEVVLAEDGSNPLALVLPPFDDLAEIESLRGRNFSLRERVQFHWRDLEDRFAVELEALQRKRSRFANSPSYLGKLADIAELAGKQQVELEALRGAIGNGGDVRFARRLGDVLIGQLRYTEADQFFSGTSLRDDWYVKLRLAFLRIREKDYESAILFATRALEIAPFNFATLLLHGGLQLVSGQFERAIRDFRSAAEVRPNSSALYANMGVAFACLRRPDKALGALRRAVALDPLNAGAVAMLADLAFKEDRNEDAVPSLRLFLQFEQGNAHMWSRLKREAAISVSPGVWNNLGVAYSALRDTRRAMESYKQAMEVAADLAPKDLLLAGRNLAVLMANHVGPKEALRLTEPLIANDSESGFHVLSDRDLADLYSVAIGSLRQLGEDEKALRLAEFVLSNPKSVVSLRAWVVSGLIAKLALTEGHASIAVEFAKRYASLLDELGDRDREQRVLLLNNMAFAFIEAGQLVEAEDFMTRLTACFHKDAYPTATLGLYHFRRGHAERAERLYEEAISLARNIKDRVRIRQKLDLERARLTLEADEARTLRILERVIGAKDGDYDLVAFAKSWKRRLMPR